MSTSTLTTIRPVQLSDFTDSFRKALSDFTAAPGTSLCLASIFVIAGLAISTITWATGTTFWLILAVMGFPLIGALAAFGFYHISRSKAAGAQFGFSDIISAVWEARRGQLPWLAVIIVMIFLFWFTLAHMIFALFLGLAPMKNISSSTDVLMTFEGLQMLAFGSIIGAIFAALVFGISVIGMPLILDREVDFVTALVTSLGAVLKQPVIYLIWGAIIGVVTILSMMPAFLGLFLTMPIFGFMTWHLYACVSQPDGQAA